MASQGHQDAGTGFLQLAGHPLRWRLLSELAHSDRRVRELTQLVEQPQSLVSYHLGRLRRHGLVSARRSAANGRDSYYRIDLARCGDLLVATGAALHPALRLTVQAHVPPRVAGAARVLFLCTGNSARSQIAEALIEARTAGAVEAFSAGSHPKPLHPAAVRVMARRGIDLSGKAPKHVSAFAGQRFTAVVTLCDRVREVCPSFPDGPKPVHWSIPDPARDGRAGEAVDAAFERTARELDDRIGYLVHELAIGP